MKIFLIVGWILSSLLLSADQIVSREGDIITVVSSGEYVMGDSDNRKESRQMALTQAKVNASEMAGSYIESNFESLTQQTNNGNIVKISKKELRSFSAAIIESEIIHDSFEMLAEKTTVYKITIKARIDLAILHERIQQIGEDKNKKEMLVKLEKENKELIQSIDRLNSKIRRIEERKDIKFEDIGSLHNERAEILTKLGRNEDAVKLVFEKKVIRNDYEVNKNIEREKINFLQKNIKTKLNSFINVNIQKPVIIGEEEGHYKVHLPYAWEYNHEFINKTLLEYGIKTESFDSIYGSHHFTGGNGNSIEIQNINETEVFNKMYETAFPETYICIEFSLLGSNVLRPIGKSGWLSSSQLMRPSLKLLQSEDMIFRGTLKSQNGYRKVNYNFGEDIVLLLSKEQIDELSELKSKVVMCDRNSEGNGFIQK